MAKLKLSSKRDRSLPNLPDYDPEPADGMRVGTRPVPGITLQRILRGHKDWISRIVWSPNGRVLASSSSDKTICIWDVIEGECTATLKGHQERVNDVTWSPKGNLLASGSHDKTIRVWDSSTKACLATLPTEDWVTSVAWAPNGKYLATGARTGTIFIWDTLRWELMKKYQGYRGWIGKIAWAPDGELFASATDDNSIQLWNVETGKIMPEWEEGWHNAKSLTWSKNDQTLLAAMGDSTIQVWDIATRKLLQILEGHTSEVTDITLSSQDEFIASVSWDDTVKIWQFSPPGIVASITSTHEPRSNWQGIAFHPTSTRLATLGEKDTAIRIWDLDRDILLDQSYTDSIRYATAKLVLVGDARVGKTSLGWRLAYGKYKEHDPTHGQQFWVIDDLYTTREDGVECEAVLWDLAGQHIYRHCHPLFLDNVDLALLLFDLTKGKESLNGVEFWINQLSGKDKLPPSVLVGTCADAGDSILTQEELFEFCECYNINGGHVLTSAKKKIGLNQLIAILKSTIPWESMTTTITTVTFKRIKNYVLSLKEKPNWTSVLVKPIELRKWLESAWRTGENSLDVALTNSGHTFQSDTTRGDWQFTDAEMMTAVSHLETHGYVVVLRTSTDEQLILLAPDLLVNLVSSIVILANGDVHGLGSLSETQLLKGNYPLKELEKLSQVERETLIDAAILRFLEHNICFRKTLGADTLLIFPGLIKQEKPLYGAMETIEDVCYIVRGAVENVYAALVVLLGYDPSFTRVNQWRNQAEYTIGEGEICGFRQNKGQVGETNLIFYYTATTPTYVRAMFQGLFENHLCQHDVQVIRHPPVRCEKEHPQGWDTVIKRLNQGKDFIFCPDCGKRVALPQMTAPQALERGDGEMVPGDQYLGQLRKNYEQYLSRVKSFCRNRDAPRCYVSYLPAQGDWVAKLLADLRKADIHVIEEFTQVKIDDFFLFAATVAYKEASQQPDSAIAADLALIKQRIGHIKGHQSIIIPLLLDGDPRTSYPQVLNKIWYGDFRDETHYLVALFELVLILYGIPFNDLRFSSLCQNLRQQWEQIPKENHPPEVRLEQSDKVKQPIKGGIDMSGISRELMQKLRKTLNNCGPFNSNSELIDTFIDERISPWGDRAPSADNRASRISALINLLYPQNNVNGQNALALFLRVVSDSYDPKTACYKELVQIAVQLEQETHSDSTAESLEQEMSETYIDFDLHIAPNGHTMASSPEGQATAEISLEVPNTIELALNLIEARQSNAKLLKQVGQAFYDWLFSGNIRTHLHQTEARARSEKAKIRLRLRIEAENIASLPLEFLYRETGGYFVALNPSTVLSRYLNLPLPPERVRRREGPLHMLAIIADPTDQTRLPPDEWEAIIKEALARPLANGQMTLQTVKRATRKEIRNALLQQKPDIIQFVGHGIYQASKGYLALVNEETGKTWLVDDERFAGLYLGHDDNLGLISLATCESAKSDDLQGFLGIAPQLVQRGVPAVLAMQYKVLIKTAKIFLEDFYTSIAARKPIDWATQSARNAISQELGLDNREFATPVLYMRAQDGYVF